MSKKSRKVVDKSKINELLNQKGKDMLGEAFEGIGGIVELGAIHNMDGFSSAKYVDNTKPLNETIPAVGREWSNLEKAEKVYTKAVLDLGKAVGKQDKDGAKDVVGLYRTLSASMKKFKELLSREILDKIQ